MLPKTPRGPCWLINGRESFRVTGIGVGRVRFKDSRHFVIQSEAKLKPTVTRSHTFSRASRRLCLRVTVHGSLDWPGCVNDTIENLVTRLTVTALKVRLTAIFLSFLKLERVACLQKPPILYLWSY